MSTADSQLLVASSSMVRDIYQKVIRHEQDVEQRKLVLYSRIFVLLLVILAIILAFLAADWVFWLVLFAWGGLGASFGPTILLSLFWKRTTKWGVLVGLISGTLVTIIWKSTPFLSNLVYELVPAFTISFILTIIVSLVTKSTEVRYN
jgi:Na+/proline symporter